VLSLVASGTTAAAGVRRGPPTKKRTTKGNAMLSTDQVRQLHHGGGNVVEIELDESGNTTSTGSERR
jgi:hypothetical protein